MLSPGMSAAGVPDVMIETGNTGGDQTQRLSEAAQQKGVFLLNPEQP